MERNRDKDMHMWIRHSPVFACDGACRPLYYAAPWAGLRPFAYDYVRNIRPGKIVELGTHYGCSAFCFLQAVQDGGLPVSVTLIDSWQGDPFTANDYAAGGVWEMFEQVREQHYGKCGVTVRRERFEQAAEEIGDGSIDLLHIDGSHLYEDVRRDYEMWKSKVRGNGTIFLHDVTARLHGAPLGTVRFWEELRQTEPYTLTIPFSCGLGIVCRDREVYSLLRKVAGGHYYEALYEQQTEQIKADLREAYFVSRSIGDRPGPGHGSVSEEMSGEHY